MRIGLIARADNTGLGNQTWELYRHLYPDRTYIIDLTEVNASMGKQTGFYPERYPYASTINGFPTIDQCRLMLENIDVLVTVEIPYNYLLFSLAREMGVKTVLQYNYEFLDYLKDPDLPLPDVLLAPSKWHFSEVLKSFGSDTLVKYLPVPVATDRIKYTPRRRARHFFHVAGHPTHMDRNGTSAVLSAMKYVKSPIKLTVHSQYRLPVDTEWDNRIEYVDTEAENYWDIYNNTDYDVMLLPRRYGGLSLQLNEALAAGIPVVMTDVEPQNRFLPEEVLIGVSGKEEIMTRTVIECWDPDPEALAEKIDELYGDDELVEDLSKAAGDYRREIAWKTLAPEYIKLLEDLCQQP